MELLVLALEALEANIELVIGEIRLQMFEKVVKNWTSTMSFVKNSLGGHMSEITFKY